MASKDYRSSYRFLKEAEKDQQKPKKSMSGKKGQVQINPADLSSPESLKDAPISKQSIRSSRKPVGNPEGQAVLRSPYDFDPPGGSPISKESIKSCRKPLAKPEGHGVLRSPYDFDPPESLSGRRSNVMPFVEKEPDESIDFISAATSASLKLVDSPKLPRNVAVCEKILILENAGLRSEISNLKAQAENCSQEITLLLKRLKQCLMKQTLENKEEINIILAGLKQTTDLLKGDDEQSDTVSQTTERGHPWRDVNESVPTSSMTSIATEYYDCNSSF